MGTFAEKVRFALKRQKVSQTELADAIGTHQPTVSDWLGNDVTPSLGFVIAIARKLDLSLDYLLIDEDVTPKPLGRPALSRDEDVILTNFRAFMPTVDPIIRAMAVHSTVADLRKPPAPTPAGPLRSLPTESTSIGGPPPDPAGRRHREGA